MRSIRISAFFALVLLLSTVGCATNKDSWEKKSSNSFDEIQYDRQGNLVWAVNFLDSKLHRLDLVTGAVEEILLPPDVRISDICFSNGLWLAGFNKRTGDNMIMKYSDIKLEDVFQSAVILGCKVMKNGDILFWDKSMIISISISSGGTIQEIQGVKENVITDVFRTDDGKMWMLTTDGKVYTNDGSGSWTLFAESPLYKHLFVDRSYLWVAGNQGIYRYQTSLQRNEENLLEAPLGFYQDIFKTQNGWVWVVTSESIWAWKDNSFNVINLPSGTTLLKGYSLDYRNNIVFISTNQGIYSLKLDE